MRQLIRRQPSSGQVQGRRAAVDQRNTRQSSASTRSERIGVTRQRLGPGNPSQARCRGPRAGHPWPRADESHGRSRLALTRLTAGETHCGHCAIRERPGRSRGQAGRSSRRSSAPTPPGSVGEGEGEAGYTSGARSRLIARLARATPTTPCPGPTARAREPLTSLLKGRRAVSAHQSGSPTPGPQATPSRTPSPRCPSNTRRNHVARLIIRQALASCHHEIPRTRSFPSVVAV